MRIAGIGEAHIGDSARIAPGTALHDKTRLPVGNAEQARDLLRRCFGTDPVFGSAPRNMAEQPGAWRNFGKVGFSRFRHGRQIDEALFDTEFARTGEMDAENVEQRCPDGNVEPLTIRAFRAAPFALQDFEAIVEAKGFDLGPDIVNLKNGGLNLRLADETAGFLAALDQTGLGELAHDLVHRHARTVILIGEVDLERQSMARRPFSRNDPALDLSEDTLVQGLPG